MRKLHKEFEKTVEGSIYRIEEHVTGDVSVFVKLDNGSDLLARWDAAGEPIEGLDFDLPQATKVMDSIAHKSLVSQFYVNVV